MSEAMIPESRSEDAEILVAPSALGPPLPTPYSTLSTQPSALPISRLPHIVRNVLVVAISFGLAAAAGLLRNIIIGAEFGIGADLDAYYAAFKLPDLLFTIVAGGALATAFIPVFADFLVQDDRTDAWRLASAITNLVFLVVTTTAVVVGVLAPWLVRTLIAPGFSPAEQAETVQVMRIVLVSTVIFGISAVQGSVLHGFKHFLLPALGAALYPLGIAAGAIFLAPTMGVTGLAIGAVVGSLLHLLIKVPALIYYGFRWWPVLDLRNSAVHQSPGAYGPTHSRPGRVPTYSGGYDQPGLAAGPRRRQLSWSGAGTPCSCRRPSSARHLG